MKIHLFFMLPSIFAFLGCSNKPSTNSQVDTFGPFTIEAVTKTGKTWDVNFGRVDFTDRIYKVKYKGQPIHPGHLETNTDIPGVWRVFYLKEAHVPTLILGSQSLYLVTEENGQVHSKPLYQQSSGFSSIQWLDSENGQPGDYREVYSTDPYDTEMELFGGRYMAISRAVVLDTRTFDIFPFNTLHDYIEGYYTDQNNAVALSPDSTQVVYCGAKQDENDNMIFHRALVCYDFKNGGAYVVPFDLKKTYLKDAARITNEWVADFFEWKASDNPTWRLSLKVFEDTPPRKGTLLHERSKGNTFTLDPVKESMMDHLVMYIKKEFRLDTTSAYRLKDDYYNRYFFKIADTVLALKYGEYGHDLVLYVDQPEQVTKATKELVSRIAKGFNAMLTEGEYRDAWILEENVVE